MMSPTAWGIFWLIILTANVVGIIACIALCVWVTRVSREIERERTHQPQDRGTYGHRVVRR